MDRGRRSFLVDMLLGAAGLAASAASVGVLGGLLGGCSKKTQGKETPSKARQGPKAAADAGTTSSETPTRPRAKKYGGPVHRPRRTRVQTPPPSTTSQ